MNRNKNKFKSRKTLNIWGFGGGNSGGGGGAAEGGTQGNSAQGGAAAATNVGTVPGAAAPAAAPTFEQNLDAIAQTWQAPNAAKKAAMDANGGQPSNAHASPFAHITDEAVTKAASGARISTAIKPETLSALFDGNVEKSQAFAGILDQVFQAGIVVSARNAMKIGDTSIDHVRAQVQDSMLPDYMKNFQVQQAVTSANPMLSHPAYKPVYDAMVAGLGAQYPNATPQEISAKAQEQLKTLAEGLTKGSTQNPNTQTTTNGGGNQIATSVFDDNFFK